MLHPDDETPDIKKIHWVVMVTLLVGSFFFMANIHKLPQPEKPKNQSPFSIVGTASPDHVSRDSIKSSIFYLGTGRKPLPMTPPCPYGAMIPYRY